MKHLFIINPKAGKKNPMKTIFPEIKKVCGELGIAYDYKVTKYPGHATEIVRNAAESKEKIRIFSCGGDGTLCETANGAIGFDNVELGCIPCGSGNDYIKSYDEKAFFDLKRNIGGEAIAVDAIKCGDKYAVNICSMGIDSEVANRMSKIKRFPFISGKMAYNLSVLRTFLGKMNNEFTIKIDDREEIHGNFLFAVAACGVCYGGGYMAGCGAVTNDGLLDIVMVKKVPKLKILQLLGPYKNGTYIHDKRFDGILTRTLGKKMTVKCNKKAAFNRDGECVEIDDIEMRILPSAMKFVIPQGVAYNSKCKDFIKSNEGT